MGRPVARQAQAHPAEVRGADPREPGRARAARDARHGQADQRQPARRHARRGALHPAGTPKPSTRSTTRSRRPGAMRSRSITREPLGVVGAIVPWNFPLVMAAWKIGPVLAAGNSLVLKPSREVAADRDPRGGARASRPAFPKACSTWCPGFGHTAGKALALHMDVDCIAFTGSTATGRQMHAVRRAVEPEARLARVRRQVAEHRVRRLRRSRHAPPQPRRSRSSSTRARCARAGSRLLVHESIKDAMLEKIAGGRREACSRAIRSIPTTKLGAIVDDIQMKRVLGYIDAGREDGAQRALGRQARARGERRLLRRAHRVRSA